MFYKVVVDGVTVEFTKKRSEAESAFKESGRRDKQLWQIGHKFAARLM